MSIGVLIDACIQEKVCNNRLLCYTNGTTNVQGDTKGMHIDQTHAEMASSNHQNLQTITTFL